MSLKQDISCHLDYLKFRLLSVLIEPLPCCGPTQRASGGIFGQGIALVRNPSKKKQPKFSQSEPQSRRKGLDDQSQLRQQIAALSGRTVVPRVGLEPARGCPRRILSFPWMVKTFAQLLC